MQILVADSKRARLRDPTKLLGWRSTSLVGEGLRNAETASFRTLALFVVATVAFCWTGISTAQVVNSSLALQADLRKAGSEIIVIESGPNGLETPVSAAECAALTSHPFVIHSGAIFPDHFVSDPRSTATLFRLRLVTQGASQITLIVSNLPAAGHALVSPELAQELGFKTGNIIGIQDRNHNEYYLPSQIRELDHRFPQLARSVLVVVAPSGNAQECIVEVDARFLSAARGGELLAHFSAPIRTLIARPLMAGGNFNRSPQAEYARSLPVTMGVPLAVLIALMWTMLCRTRRKEWGLYSALGVSAASRIVIATVELAGTLTPAIGTAIVASILYARFDGIDIMATNAALFAVLRVAAGTWILCGLATLIATQGRSPDELKDT